MAERSSQQIAPLFLGPANAEAATGVSWRWCRDTALALGVPVVGHGRKQLIDAAAFRAALAQREPTAENDNQPIPTEVAAAQVREAIRRASGQ